MNEKLKPVFKEVFKELIENETLDTEFINFIKKNKLFFAKNGSGNGLSLFKKEGEIYFILFNEAENIVIDYFQNIKNITTVSVPVGELMFFDVELFEPVKVKHIDETVIEKLYVYLKYLTERKEEYNDSIIESTL